jgi:hypothetical protein
MSIGFSFSIKDAKTAGKIPQGTTPAAFSTFRAAGMQSRFAFPAAA